MTEPKAMLIGPGRIPAVGGTDSLLKLLQLLAVESGREELVSTPLIFWGHSAGGGLISRLAATLPQRTIAFVRYHSGADFADMKVLSKLPALILVGGKDPGNQGGAEMQWKDGRSLGAPRTFGIEPGATHGDPNDLKRANALLISWLTAVARQRLPPNGGALRDVADRSAWMGNNRTLEFAPFDTYPAAKPEASWLPDEMTAHAWRALLQTAK